MYNNLTGATMFTISRPSGGSVLFLIPYQMRDYWYFIVFDHETPTQHLHIYQPQIKNAVYPHCI